MNETEDTNEALQRISDYCYAIANAIIPQQAVATQDEQGHWIASATDALVSLSRECHRIANSLEHIESLLERRSG